MKSALKFCLYNTTRVFSSVREQSLHRWDVLCSGWEGSGGFPPRSGHPGESCPPPRGWRWGASAWCWWHFEERSSVPEHNADSQIHQHTSHQLHKNYYMKSWLISQKKSSLQLNRWGTTVRINNTHFLHRPGLGSDQNHRASPRLRSGPRILLPSSDPARHSLPETLHIIHYQVTFTSNALQYCVTP